MLPCAIITLRLAWRTALNLHWITGKIKCQIALALGQGRARQARHHQGPGKAKREVVRAMKDRNR